MCKAHYQAWVHTTAEALRREGCMKEAKGHEDQDTIRLPFQSGLEFTVNEQLITRSKPNHTPDDVGV
ncbi:hypothetical protein OUZ56_001079 [Daphnia magna]|uniref:Uncharacterized protein n=1 Tax=Daphnia magna TaxID=35525 RepID=A0ABR0A1P7_9CRUS|nr:hypothetical protein OUZ56_001079 [Daphnia magna]